VPRKRTPWWLQSLTGAVTVIGVVLLSMEGWFIAQHHRLPLGSGEVWNWWMGISS
jgi:hypothetical protein